MEIVIAIALVSIMIIVIYMCSKSSKPVDKDTLFVNQDETGGNTISPPKPPTNIPPPKSFNEPTIGYQIVAARSKPEELRTEEEKEIVEEYSKYPPYTWEHTMEYYIQRYTPLYRAQMTDLVNRYMAGKIGYHDFLVEFNKIHTEALRNHAFAF